MANRDFTSEVEPAGKETVVLLTPTGRGAVGTVLIRADSAARKVDQLFRAASGKLVQEMPIGRVAYGTWKLGTDHFEEVVVCRRDERSVEVHCHGGQLVTQAVIESLTEIGFEPISWQDWAAQIADDAIAASARVALAEARTQRAAAILLDQYHGALGEAIGECARFLEADQAVLAVRRLTELLQFAEIGAHLVNPWRVVVAGPPNVGKSSLINAILGYQRSIVFDQPGTTRDVLAATTALDGWPVEFCDTAGLRTHQDDIEAQGIEMARQQIAGSDLVVLVFDASGKWSPADNALRQSVATTARRLLVVHNKQDIAHRPPPDAADLQTSAKTGEGVNDLMVAVVAALVPNAPPPGAAVPFTSDQAAAIEASLALARSGKKDAAIARLRSVQSPRNVVGES